jgi:hypothetical protein
MTAQADRRVVFTLGVEIDPAAQQTIRQFRSEMDKARGTGGRGGGLGRAGIGPDNDQAKVAAANKAFEAEQAGLMKLKAVRERAEASEIAADRRRETRETSARQKAIAENERFFAKHAAGVEMEVAGEIKAREKAEKEAAGAREKAVALSERANARMVRANQAGSRAMMSVLSSALTIGSGIAKLGLLGEESTEKIVKGFVKIYSVMEVLRGGIGIWRALTRAIQMYERAVAAAAVAQAAMTGVGIAAGAAGGVGGVGRAARGGGGIGDIATNVAVGAAGGAALRPGLWGFLQHKATQAGALAWGTARWGAQRLPGITAGLTPGYLLGESFNYLSSGETLNTAWREWRQARAGAKASTVRLGELEESGMQALAGREQAKVEAKARTAERTAYLETQARTIEGRLVGRGLAGDELQAELTRRMGGVYYGQRTALQTNIAAGEAAASRLMPAREQAANAGWLQVQKEALSEILDKETDNLRRRQQAERDIAKTRTDSANDAIDKARKEIDLRKKDIEEARKTLLTGEERFGAMDPEEQRRVVKTMQAVQRGERASVEDLKRLEGLGTMESEGAAREQYRQYAQEALANMGFRSRSPWEVNRFGGPANAFERLMGQGRVTGGELGKIAGLEGETRDLAAEIDRQGRLKEVMSRNAQEVAQAIAQEIESLETYRDSILIENIRRELGNTVHELNKKLEDAIRDRLPKKK